jgi:hypothetical protein
MPQGGRACGTQDFSLLCLLLVMRWAVCFTTLSPSLLSGATTRGSSKWVHSIMD